MSHKVLRLPGVIEKTGLSKSTVYDRIAGGTFPRQFRLGSSRSSGWLESELDDWIQRQIDIERRIDLAVESSVTSPLAGDKPPIRCAPSAEAKNAQTGGDRDDLN